MLEGRKFQIFTDQKPLTRAFLTAKNPVSNRQRHQLAVISEFATDIAHVPGLENVVVDALSRQFDDEKEVAVVHTVAHALVDVDLSQLATDQPPIDEEAETSLRLQNCRFPGVKREIVCDVSQERPHVLVPEGRRRKIFDAIHGLAHPSGRSTLAMVARTYIWPGMRQDVLRWARQCVPCATCTVSRHTRPPVVSIEVPAKRFSHIHLDIVGPFSPDGGSRYILTMVDRTTRWPEAVPIPETSEETILQAFLSTWVARFGIPRTVTTDRGAQFSSTLLRSTLG